MAKNTEIIGLTAADLRRAADLQDKITAMQAELARLLGGAGSAPAKAGKAVKTGRRKPNISAAGRRRIAAAQKARWAKVKAEKSKAAPAESKKAK